MDTENKDEIVQLYLDDIIPNRFQPREVFDERALKELAVSIREHGVIQPIIVRSVNGKYEIIAGERRYKASALAGLTKIPAIIRDLDDKESSKVALLENLQRKNLNPIEEARTYHKILEIDEMTQEALAKTMGKSQSAVANKIRLLTLPEDIQEALLKEEISERHARALLNVSDTEIQKKLLEKIVSTKMSVRALEEEIRTLYPKEKEASEIPIEEDATASKERFIEEKPLVPHVQDIEEETSNYGKVVIAPPKEEPKEEEDSMGNRFINYGELNDGLDEASSPVQQQVAPSTQVAQPAQQTVQQQAATITPPANNTALDNLLEVPTPQDQAPENNAKEKEGFDFKDIPNIKIDDEDVVLKDKSAEVETKKGNPLPTIITSTPAKEETAPAAAPVSEAKPATNDAVKKIKDLIAELKAQGVSISADEMDFPNSFQIIIKIDK